MKRLIPIVLLAFLALPAFTQQYARWDLGTPGSAGAVTVSGTGLASVLAQPGVKLNFCAHPANAVPCTNFVTTFTSLTGGVSCSTATQIVLQGSSTCVATGANDGSLGVYYLVGPTAFDYTLTVNGVSYGPFVITPGVGTGGGGGGAANPAGLDTQLQFNDGLTSFGGASAKNGTTQATYNKTTGRSNFPNFENIRFADASYNWSQLPAADLTTPGSGKTITLTPCPLGIDVTANANFPYSVYISTVGTAESVPVTGGTCTSGGASGTIIVTTGFTHAAGYTVSTASTGIQEAINDGCGVGGTCQVQLVPSGSSAPNYTVRATVYVHGTVGGTANKIHLIGNGAYVNCATRDVCIFNGTRGATAAYSVMQGIRFTTAVNVDGVQITGISAAGGTYTVTAPSHPFVTGDYASIDFYSPNSVQHTVQKVTVTDASHFTFTFGSLTFSNTAPTWGWATIENAAIEDNAQGAVLRDIDFAATGGAPGFSYGIVIDNDQNANVEHLTLSSGLLKCTTNFCGAWVFVRGDSGNAGILHLSDSDFTINCAGSGILSQNGNSMSIRDTVIQGFAQYGVRYDGGLQGALISNLYEEVGNCSNPQYPGTLQAEAGVQGTQITIQGTAPIAGSDPVFANTGANQRNYFVVPKSTTFGAGPVLFIGSATTNNAGTVNLYWPQVVNDNSGGTITYDVLLTTGSTGPSPYLAVANSLATAQTGSCTNGICTFADTHAATSAYTVSNQLWFPHLYFWPGSYIGTDTTNRDAAFGVPQQFTLDRFATNGQSGYASSYGIKIPSVTALNCLPTQITLSPAWIICSNTFTSSSIAQATVYQQVGGTTTPAANSKGRLNLGTSALTYPLDLITLLDSNINKTFATANNRPLADANDGAVSADQAGGLAIRAQTSITHYLATLADNSSWTMRLTATLLALKVPMSIQAGGSSSVLNIADSGSNCTNGTSNSSQLCSGTPSANTIPSGVYWPLWCTNISGAQTCSQIEMIGNKDQASGYPSLDSTGILPIAEIVTNTAGCTGASFILGDRSGCSAAGGAPAFSAILSGTNSTMTAHCDTGCTIDTLNNGIVNASKVNSVAYPSNSAGAGGLGAADRFIGTTAAGTTSGRDVPNCTAAGSFLQYNTSTHNFACTAAGGAAPMIEFACTGVSGVCPNATEYNGDSNPQIMALVTIPASTLTTGKCMHAVLWWTHSTGTASISYAWNIGGTGTVNTDVTGGTSTGNQASASTANYLESQVDVCAYATNAIYVRSHALQVGSTQIAGTVTNAVSQTLSSNFNLNFLFTVAAGDKVTFNGGYVNFP